MTNHALYSASSSHKWLNCPASLTLEKVIEDEESEYAKKGSLAHSICELKVRKNLIEPMASATYTRKLNKFKKDSLYDDSMERSSEEYLDKIREIVYSCDSAPYITVEKRVDYSAYAPDGFGTADCIVIYDKNMWVVDYKNGQGVKVNAERNPQLMLYGLGAYEAYKHIFAIENINLVIVQPNINNISEYTIGIDALVKWGNDVVKTAVEKTKVDNPECVPGNWCSDCFCNIRGICRARGNEFLSLEEETAKEPATYSNDEIAKLLERVTKLSKWAEEVKTYALNQILKGNDIPGYKAVEGRSNRAFSDTEGAFNKLEAEGYAMDLLYVRKPLTLSEIEKLLGTAKFNELLSEFVTRPQGKPTLVPESDKREKFVVKSSAKEAFKEPYKEG